MQTQTEKLKEKGFRFADNREYFAYFGSLMTGVKEERITPKEKEETINAINVARKELGISVGENVVPIDFKIPGD